MIAPIVLARYGTTLPVNVCSHCGEVDSPENTRHWPDDQDGDRICPPCATPAVTERSPS